MISALFWVAVGIFIGWNIERPQWSKDLQDRVVNYLKSLIDNNKI